MTFGEKIKEARKQNGLSQEELAQKICVSRSAITKWEPGRGMPDIENLKMISVLLDISIDYLLADSDMVIGSVLKQPINLGDYPKASGFGLNEDFVVLEYYPGADNIWQLARTRKLSIKEHIADFIFPGMQYLSDHWRDPSIYYLVEQKDVQYLVNVTKDFIISQKLTHIITDKSFEMGEQKFTKTYHKIK